MNKKSKCKHLLNGFTAYKQNWEKGWLDKVLDQADQAVQNWPDWMRKPELRYPLNRHANSQNTSSQPTEMKSRIKLKMKTIEKKYKQRLEKIITDAKKDGITIFAHHEGVLIIVPTAIYDATDDLRHLLNSEYPTVDIGMHGTPVMRQRDPNMGS